MISRDIDLTENNDFQDKTDWGLMDIEVDMSFEDLIDLENISISDYDKLHKYLDIFGTNRHYNSRHNIFKESDEEYWRRVSTHCARCNKPLRFPWKYNDGLCNECNDDLEIEFIDTKVDSVVNKKMPWQPIPRWMRHEAKEIFDLK